MGKIIAPRNKSNLNHNLFRIIKNLGREIANKKKMIDTITVQRCILSPNHEGYKLNIKKTIVKKNQNFSQYLFRLYDDLYYPTCFIILSYKTYKTYKTYIKFNQINLFPCIFFNYQQFIFYNIVRYLFKALCLSRTVYTLFYIGTPIFI